MHQYGHSISCETQVQLYSGGPVSAGLKNKVMGEGDEKKRSFKSTERTTAKGATQEHLSRLEMSMTLY